MIGTRGGGGGAGLLATTVRTAQQQREDNTECRQAKDRSMRRYEE